MSKLIFDVCQSLLAALTKTENALLDLTAQRTILSSALQKLSIEDAVTQPVPPRPGQPVPSRRAEGNPNIYRNTQALSPDSDVILNATCPTRRIRTLAKNSHVSFEDICPGSMGRTVDAIFEAEGWQLQLWEGEGWSGYQIYLGEGVSVDNCTEYVFPYLYNLDQIKGWAESFYRYRVKNYNTHTATKIGSCEDSIALFTGVDETLYMTPAGEFFIFYERFDGEDLNHKETEIKPVSDKAARAWATEYSYEDALPRLKAMEIFGRVSPDGQDESALPQQCFKGEVHQCVITE